MNFLEVVILAFVEGVTEFLPISSTGHLIITSWLFGIQEEGFVKSFNVIIQFGAILSVLAIYWRRFLPQKKNLLFYQKIIVAFLPAAIIGLLVKSKIDLILGSVTIVASSLIVGGLILIWSDRYYQGQMRSGRTIDQLSFADCLKLGLLQCFAFIPGISRSGATIVGGLALGLNRKEATEFSFFLAVPTLTGAALVKGLGIVQTLNPEDWQWLALGTFLSFVFAWIAIQFFIKLVSRHGFTHFGIYRIILGIIIIGFV